MKKEVEGFKDRMAEHGLDPGEIISDGVIHRFQTWGDASGETSGAYWHNGRFGWFQDWRSMEKPQTVHGKLTETDRAALNGSFAESKHKVSREALEAGIRRIWNAGTEPDGHPYLKKKGITAPPQVKQYEKSLIIPVFGVNGELNGLQRIDPDGRKRFLEGTRKKGSFFSIPGNGNFLICEGFATGVSLHEATGASIAVAFDAGNLSDVAKAISKKADLKNIIIAGDDDSWKIKFGKKNKGFESAVKAALENNVRFILPKFKEPDLNKTTDFNDLARVEGLEAVKKQILSVPPFYEFISLSEISSLDIQDNPVIDGLLGEKESLIISAASGVGKSLIANQIAMVCGNPPECGLWGLFKIPKKVTSLIVQSENGMGAVSRRLRKNFNANPPALREGSRSVFMIRNDDDVRLSGCLTETTFQSLLIDSLNELEARLLILDPLVSYHDKDENDNAAMRTVLDCVTSICDKTGASAIICHHFNRQDMTRGAAAIRDWAANFLLLNFEKKIEGSTILRCTHDKSRNYETVPEFYLERTPDLQFLRCEKPGKQSKQIEAVITALTVMGGCVDSQTPLKNALMVELNCGEATARRAINEALKMKKIIITPGNKKGEPNAYSLPNEVF